jgi:hypothetical protein
VIFLPQFSELLGLWVPFNYITMTHGITISSTVSSSNSLKVSSNFSGSKVEIYIF